jgi:uncharacterized membrane protein YcaP (DUF421 family)
MEGNKRSVFRNERTISVRNFHAYSGAAQEMPNVKPKAAELNFMFIDEGEANEITLHYCGKPMDWLYEELGKKRYTKIKAILYAKWAEDEGFYIKTYNENEHKEITE